MARSSSVSCADFLAVVVLWCAVPSTLGPAHDTPPSVQAEEPAARNANSPAYHTTPRIQAVRPPPPTLVGRLFTVVSRCRMQLSERERWRIVGTIHRESQRYGYNPLFILAMIEVESTCLSTARSRRGAVGLIQIKPSVARAVAEEAGLQWQGATMLTAPAFNVHLGLRYLSQLQKQFGDLRLALAAYNLGPTRVAKMPRHRARRTEYVQKILSRYEALLAQDTDDAVDRDS
jgi:soluble lytic murein transglycosylase-like protein